MYDPLDSPSLDARHAGRKAANLNRLLAVGMRVPPGFVLAPDADVARMSDDDLLSAVERCGGFPVAVRSSGALEDLEGTSFAGLYETFLGVGTLAELREKIDACRASGRTDRVRAYLDRHGLRTENPVVAPLVQRMVDARIAGVAFSVDPMTGKEEHALVECCNGLGEKLVSGQITPSRYRLGLRDGAILHEEIGPDGATLDREQARALSATLIDVQALFGAPQDVEWAIDQAGTLFILQSRPITKVQFREDIEEFTNADFKDGGISARVCTPLMFSLYENAMQPSMQTYFEELKLIPRGRKERWIAMYYGRGYWNASAVKRALGRVPGFDEEKFDQDLGVQKVYGQRGPTVVPSTLRTILPVLPVAIALERSYERQLRIAQRFGQAFRKERSALETKIAAFEDTADRPFFSDLERVLFEFHARTERTYFTTIYNNANTQSDVKAFLAKLDVATGRKTSILKLMSGLDDVHHMDTQRGINGLCRVAKAEGMGSAAFATALKTFLGRFGFHSDAELDITVPRWSESPGRIEELVQGILDAGILPADPDATVAAQKKEFEEELASVRNAIRRRLLLRVRFSGAFEKHVRRLREYLSARERMREYSTQCYAIVRAYVLEAGRRLAARGDLPRNEDVFMLSIAQLRELTTGRKTRTEVAEEIAFRRKMYEGYRAFDAPNELGASVTQRSRPTFVATADGKRVLVGLGCSPKNVIGVVRVVTSLDDVHLLREGDILVTKTTDPGWTPVLGLVAGVITEVGGLLSHAAVIGREYGIPAVLNLQGATMLLRSGQRVRMDGATGVVEVLDDGGETDQTAPASTRAVE